MVLKKKDLVYLYCPHKDSTADIGAGHVVYHWLVEHDVALKQSKLYVTNVYINHSSTQGTFSLLGSVNVEDKWAFTFENYPVVLAEANSSEPASLEFTYGSINFPNDYIPIGTFDHGNGVLTWTTKGGEEMTTDGTTIRVSFDAILSGGDAGFENESVSQVIDIDLSLPELTRAYIPDNIYIEDDYTIILDIGSGVYAHSVRYEFGELSGYIGADGYITDVEEKITGTSLNFSVPEDFYTQIPNSTIRICTLYVVAYSNENTDEETLVGETVLRPMVNVTYAKVSPTLEVSAADVNLATIALTGDSSILVRHASNLSFTISSEAKHGATIVSRTINGVEISSDSYVENGASNSQYKVVVVDSRGLTTSETLTFEIIDYIPLTSEVTAKRPSPTANTIDLKVVGNYYDGVFTSESNEISVSYYITGSFPAVDSEDETVSETRSGTITPSIVTKGYNGSISLSDTLYTQGYEIGVTVSDKLSSITKTIKIGQGIPVFEWGADDFTVNKKFIAKGDASVSGSLYLKDLEHLTFIPEKDTILTFKNVLLDMTHPIGSLYMSFDDTSPANLFGGKWESIKDTFILAAGDNYTVGSTGGSATHTQTMDELATHYHEMYVYNHNNNVSGVTPEVSPMYIGAINYDSIIYNNESGVAGEIPDTIKLNMTSNKGGVEVSDDSDNTTLETQPMDIMPPYTVAYVWKRIA